MPEPPKGRTALFTGGITAILASSCCLGPLLLVSLGFSGAWIGNLALLQPYRPWFIALSMIALFLAWRRLFRPRGSCQPGDACALPQVQTTYRLLFWAASLLLLVALLYPYLLPLFY